jgi:hypothetical protein
MAEFTTPNGKIVSTYIDPSIGMYRIKFTTGGELPAELSGIFTSSYVAEKTVQGYIAQVTESPKRTIKEK